MLRKRNFGKVLNAFLILVILAVYLATSVPRIDSIAANDPGQSAHEGSQMNDQPVLKSGESNPFTHGLREEGARVVPAVKSTLEDKDFLFQSCFVPSTKGLFYYDRTIQRTLPPLWNPTIPIALRRLTI